MSKERFLKPTASISGGLHVLHTMNISPYVGEIFYELRHKDGSVETGHYKNIVTLDAGILLARLMKSPGTPYVSEPSFGVYALAVGTGDIGWNPLNPPTATNTQRSLYNELSRKTVASSSFITNDGAISGVPTNKVDFSITFSESEAVGALTEMGLIGGDVNTNMATRNPILPPNGLYDPTVNVAGLDLLVNYLTFPVISKGVQSTLSWLWRLTF